ncbi:MAG: DUF2062 domain-containing protein [Pseudomonadota bacterium]
MSLLVTISRRIRDFAGRVKRLEGDPHDVALGLAIGVFIGITPTIPFHTALAIAFSFFFGASKVAAALGVWISNPVTIPIFYYLSYKIGTFLLGMSSPFDVVPRSLIELVRTGADITFAAIIGGVILGIIPGILTYILTRRILSVIHSKKLKEKNMTSAANGLK